MISSYKDLDVYNASFDFAMEIFNRTKSFPKEEVYSLTSQLIRSSRSISANIAEGWAKREYENQFKNHLIHATGSASETENWLRFAFMCKYITEEEYNSFCTKLTIISKMLTRLHQKWKTF